MILRAKKYVAVLLVFVCVCMMFFPLTAYAAEDSSQHETVKVGFFAMDGYHVMDEEGNRSGYGYDFLRLMARYWDVDYEYVGYDKSWDDMQQMLEDGEIDMVTSPRKTPEREETFDFSRPIGTNNGILTVRSDNSTIVDGKNAVEIFRNHPKGTFDVILMDVMMPEMNGYEATKAIRAMNDRPDGKNIPIIAMTANSFAEDVQASLDAGMNAHLSKPIVIDEVIKTILRYMK
ncbi:response regulator [Faecalibacterium taiwanense]|uniref:response regulator n=1 Tax=Faecalibacterium taiwanense TaxID=3030638 RepID=UPI003AAB02CB